MSADIIFDSLPYYDDDLEQYPGLKQKVERELARQARPTDELHPKVPPEFQLFTASPISCILSAYRLYRKTRCCRLK